MRIFLLIITLIGIACSSPDHEIITLSIPNNTIPSGIAVDPSSEDIFISSVHLDQLTRLNTHGETLEIELDRANDGYSIGVGIDIYRDKIYALATYDRDSFSMLYIKNKSTERTFSFRLKNKATYFNDLVVDSEGNCYITDTENNHIYRFDSKTKEISHFLSNEQIEHPNGIAISRDENKLFVDSYSHGIRIIDIHSKNILNHIHSPTAERGIGGIEYHQGKLYFIVNGIKDKSQHGLYSLDIIDEESDFGNLDPVLVFHEKMNIPTTLTIVKNCMYLLANSQINLLDQEKNIIYEPSKLTKTFILKKIISSDN